MPDDAAPLAGKRVLIVDDNATSRRLLGELLPSRGACGSPTPSSPRGALRWIGEGRRFDVVLLDMHMPGSTG